ncbi:MAG: SixA phosphatase family protein [Eggerthellaceae bacterium]|jgi:phosphohistidine phosphatase SixA
MVKTLVLVRHGKAQSRSKGLEDAVRPLTPAGLRAIKATYPKTFALLEKGDVHLWSSPYLRAFQTAQVVSDVVGDGNIEGHYSLTRSKCDEFLDELIHSENQTVIAVGHNPFMEEAIDRLVGYPMAFEKGSVAAIRLIVPEDSEKIEAKDLSGELLWFVKGPDWHRWRILQRISDDIKEVADDFDVSVKAGLGSEADHQILVAAIEKGERLRAYLSFIRPFAREHTLVEMVEYLDRILKKLYRLYSFDLLCKEISQHSPTFSFQANRDDEARVSLEPPKLSLEERLEAPDPQPTLYEHVYQVRKESWASLCELLASKKAMKRFDSFIVKAENIKWRRSVNEAGLRGEELENRFRKLMERLIGEWDTVRFGDDRATLRLSLDMLRIQVISHSLSAIASCHTEDIPNSLIDSFQDVSELCDVRYMQETLESCNSPSMYGEATYQLVSLRTYLSGQEDRLVSKLEAARQ